MKTTVYFLGLAMLVAACGGGQKSAQMDEFADSLASVDEPQLEISEENITAILESIPSPIELSIHIQEAGIEYDKALLNPETNLNNYASNFKKALNLGIYGTDLGYTNIYQHTQDGLNYLDVVYKLSEDLNISQFLDLASIERLTQDSEDLDSLLMLTNQNFDDINDHFREQKQASLSTLLLTGGWLESLHITSQVALRHMDSEVLKERVGEQKIVLDNIILLLDAYSSQDPQIADLLTEVRKLEAAYASVEIKYTYEESTSKVVDGVLEIESNSSSEVIITEEDVRKISELTEEIRNKVIS